MSLTQTSHAYQRASDLLKMPAGQWIDQQQAKGLSWRHTANELYLVTKGKMHANESTLASWHRAWKAEAAAALPEGDGTNDPPPAP